MLFSNFHENRIKHLEKQLACFFSWSRLRFMNCDLLIKNNQSVLLSSKAFHNIYLDYYCINCGSYTNKHLVLFQYTTKHFDSAISCLF